MIKILLEKDYIEIQSNSAEECVMILNNVMPKYYGDSTPLIHAPSIEDSPVNSISNSNIKPVEDRKHLVFFKCKKCGTISKAMVNPTDARITCNHCHSLVSIDFNNLYKARYVCKCGTTGKMYIEKGIESIQCRTCRKEHKLTWNDTAEQYESINLVF